MSAHSQEATGQPKTAQLIAETADYGNWTHVLCAHFFVPANSGHGITFFVDDDLLDRLVAGAKGSGAASLARAVKAGGRLLPESSGRMFEPIFIETIRWKELGPTGNNPSIPLLACAVLAASRMAAEGSIGSNNYYRRFREVLGVDGSGMPAYYDTAFRGLWRIYTWWLNEHLHGALGRSTVQGHPHLTNIFFSISQALLRNADRKRFTEFFEWMDWQPGDAITDGEIRACLPAWVEHNPHLGPGIRLMLRDEQYMPQLISAVQAEFETWGGRVLDDSGVELARIVITLDLFPRPRLSLAAQKPESWPESIVWTNGLSSETAAAQDGWYRDLELAITSELLLNGATLSSPDGSLRLVGRAVVPLRIDHSLGGWASAARTSLFEKHFLLFHDSVARDVRGFIAENAEPDWAPYGRTGVLPAQWNALKDVEFHKVPPVPTDERLSSLVPGPQVRPALAGGLRLGPAGLYLRGGEPDVVLPPPITSGLTVVIDGDSRPYPPTGGTIRMRDLHLNTGSHQVQAGFVSFTIRTIPSFGRPTTSADGSIGHELFGAAGAYRPAAPTANRLNPAAQPAVTIIGALVNASDGSAEIVEPVILHRGEDELLLLGRTPGEVFIPPDPPEPLLSHVVRGLATNRFEAQPPFEVVWIMWRSTGVWHAEARRYSRPREWDHSILPEAVHSWANALSRDASVHGVLASSLWSQYQEVAKRLL